MAGKVQLPVEQQYYPGLADACRRAYRRSIDAIRDAARECGYAVGVHGSISRDIDLIVAPWTEDAVSAEDVAEAIRAAIAATNEGWAFVNPKLKAGEKPHGRMCWSIHVHGGPFFDVSILPRLPA